MKKFEYPEGDMQIFAVEDVITTGAVSGEEEEDTLPEDRD